MNNIYVITKNTGDMEKYCLKPLPVHFIAFPMGQQLFDSVQYIITNDNPEVAMD